MNTGTKLQAFLYILMRNYLVPGEVERIVQEHVEKPLARHPDLPDLIDFVYSNEHLMAYARELEARLR